MGKMTTAEFRGYQQICGRNGAMMVVACDQRGGMRVVLAPDAAGRKAITDAMLGDTKADIVRYLANHASCVLLDPTCAVPEAVDGAPEVGDFDRRPSAGRAGRGHGDNRVPFDPDAAPHANAAALIAEHGEDAVDAIWRIGHELMHTGRGADIPRLAEAMKIVLALRRAGRDEARH